MIEVAKKKDSTWGDLKKLCSEMTGRVMDETKSRQFFSMTMREALYYEKPREGWEVAIARFPDIVDDVEEASKCFALSRYPAAVFHSVQVSEAGLIELGKFLKVADPKSGWSAVANALNQVVKKNRKDMSAFERKNFAFLEQVQGTVEGLKNAWRNKISHAQGKLVLMTKEFSPEVAEEILFATRAFMRRLAEGLPPPKGRKGKWGLAARIGRSLPVWTRAATRQTRVGQRTS